MQEKKVKKNAISKYLNDNGIKKGFFSDKAKITAPTLCTYMQGKDMFLSTAYRIVKASEGKITLEDIANGIKKLNLN